MPLLGIGVVVLASLTYLTAPPHRHDDAALARKAKAEADWAIAEAQRAKTELEKLIKELDELDALIAGAVDAVVNATTADERGAAKAKLIELQKRHYELRNRQRDAHPLDDSVVPLRLRPRAC